MPEPELRYVPDEWTQKHGMSVVSNWLPTTNWGIFGGGHTLAMWRKDEGVTFDWDRIEKAATEETALQPMALILLAAREAGRNG